MLTYHTLENTDMKVLYDAFLICFEDYIVKFQLPYKDFVKMLERRGYNPTFSIGAFDNEKLIGFIFNSCRIWDDTLTIYDIGTAVQKEYRNQGITTSMLNEVKTCIENSNIKQYLLEVIKDNTDALNLYLKQGFTIHREFECFSVVKEILKLRQTHEVFFEQTINWSDAISFWDTLPSWQNSIDAIMQNQENYCFATVKLNHKLVGYGILEPTTGDLVQIAVDKKHRHLGIASSIISQLSSLTSSENIRIINVDISNIALRKFLKKIGFQDDISQYEMRLEIN